MNREAIYSALFAAVSVAPGLVTTSRKLKHWNDVPASQRPALFQAQKREISMVQTGQPTRWLLEVDLYLYVSTLGATSPGAVLNPIVDAITAMLDLQVGGFPQTLGGMVHYARVEGTVETDEGTLGDDAVAIIPVQIMASSISTIQPVLPPPPPGRALIFNLPVNSGLLALILEDA